MKYRYFMYLFVLIYTGQCYAQDVWKGNADELTKVKENGQKQIGNVQKWKNHILEWGLDTNYNYALALSGMLYTNGYGGGFYYFIQKSPGAKVMWQLHIAEIKHEKEARQQQSGNAFPNLGKSTAYTFGKINNAYTLQIGYGREQLLFPALLEGNMSVAVQYSAGPVLALLKPYYLDLIYVDYQPEPLAHIQTERHSQANADRFLQPGFIHGGTRWNKGLGEIKYIPGLFAELAFAIEPGRPTAFVKTIMIGGNAAFYSSKIEIMADRKAYPYQASFFVGLSLGKRWK